MQKIVVDTNVFIDWRRKRLPPLPQLLAFAEAKRVELLLPNVVIMEYWAGKEMGKIRMVKKAEDMFCGFTRIVLDENIAKKAGELMRKTLVFDPTDAIIAATALERSAMVATRNKKHFQKIPGLKLF